MMDYHLWGHVTVTGRSDKESGVFFIRGAVPTFLLSYLAVIFVNKTSRDGSLPVHIRDCYYFLVNFFIAPPHINCFLLLLYQCSGNIIDIL